MIDVLVIGAGPAGNQTAHSLSRLGCSVTVLDVRENIGDKLCTGIVGRECAERYEIPPELVYREARSAELLPPGGRALRVERAEPQAYVIDRVGFVAGLAEAARASGARYRLRRRVTRLDVHEDRVAVLADADGRMERYEARAAVIASGFGTRLPRMVGLRAARTPGFAAQVIVEHDSIDEVHVLAGHGMPRGFFGWVVPAAPGTARIGLLGRARPAVAFKQMITELRRRGMKFRPIGPRRIWGVPLRPAARSHTDRVLMAGDAAGQVKPTTGGGIYYSMLSGDLAAETLADALGRDDLSAASLASYDTGWRALLGRELRIGFLARQVYERLSERDLDRLAELASANGILHEEVSFDWHADLVMRALGYKLFDTVLGPITRLGSRLATSAGL